jgi:hypothetical protein
MSLAKLIVNLVTHDINFSKIAFIDWPKLFILLKHVFYDLSYATIRSNMIKEIIKNVLSN